MKVRHKFPDFVWHPDTGKLFHNESKKYFIDHSESSNGEDATFNTIQSVHQYLSEYSIDGSVGVRLRVT